MGSSGWLTKFKDGEAAAPMVVDATAWCSVGGGCSWATDGVDKASKGDPSEGWLFEKSELVEAA